MNNFHQSNLIKNCNSKVVKIDDDKEIIYIPKGNKLLKYSYSKLSHKSEVLLEISLPSIVSTQGKKNTESDDSLLEFHLLKDKQQIVLCGASSKRILLFDENEGKFVSEYTHSKKVTGTALYSHNADTYVIFSDKFGEVFLINLSSSDPKSTLGMLYGHAEAVSFLFKTDKYLISSDALAKIKVVNFPNIFEVKTVIMYDNYRFISTFAEDKYLAIVNFNFVLHLWDLESLEKVYEVQLNCSAKRLFANQNRLLVECDGSYAEVIELSIENTVISHKKYEFKFSEHITDTDLKYWDFLSDISLIAVTSEGILNRHKLQ